MGKNVVLIVCKIKKQRPIYFKYPTVALARDYSKKKSYGEFIFRHIEQLFSLDSILNFNITDFRDGS